MWTVFFISFVLNFYSLSMRFFYDEMEFMKWFYSIFSILFMLSQHLTALNGSLFVLFCFYCMNEWYSHLIRVSRRSTRINAIQWILRCCHRIIKIYVCHNVANDFSKNQCLNRINLCVFYGCTYTFSHCLTFGNKIGWHPNVRTAAACTLPTVSALSIIMYKWHTIGNFSIDIFDC